MLAKGRGDRHYARGCIVAACTKELTLRFFSNPTRSE
jgi:hypothetical protein